MASRRGPAPWGGPFISGLESPFQDEADAFAKAVIFAICGTGVSASSGRRTYTCCLVALAMGGTARMGFRHPGKADAIDAIWRDRASLHRRYRDAADKLAALESLPWIGPVTQRRLAQTLGLSESSLETTNPGPLESRPDTTEERTGVVTNAF
jgi:hypothetical protein